MLPICVRNARWRGSSLQTRVCRSASVPCNSSRSHRGAFPHPQYPPDNRADRVHSPTLAIQAANLSEHHSEEGSTEDVLEDVRRSLIEEEETAQSEKQSRWWRRIARRGKKNEEEETPTPIEEIDLPIADDLTHIVETPAEKEEAEPEIDEIEDLIQLLEA